MWTLKNQVIMLYCTLSSAAQDIGELDYQFEHDDYGVLSDSAVERDR